MTEATLPDQDPVKHVNTVQLLGRLAAPPESRELPSGDELVTMRLVVARPPGGRRASAPGRSVTVDTIDCCVWAASLRRKIVRWAPGDQIAVEGSLRRRFWRGPGGAQSRYEVEVLKARRALRN